MVFFYVALPGGQVMSKDIGGRMLVSCVELMYALILIGRERKRDALIIIHEQTLICKELV